MNSANQRQNWKKISPFSLKVLFHSQRMLDIMDAMREYTEAYKHIYLPVRSDIYTTYFHSILAQLENGIRFLWIGPSFK